MTHEKGNENRRRHPVLAILIALSILGMAPLLEPLSAAPGTGMCAPAGSDVTKVDNPGDFEQFTAPAGQEIDAVFIKAGTQCFAYTQDSSGPCYTVDFSDDRRTVTVTRTGSGPSCRGISHIEFVTSPAPPEETTTTTQPTTTTGKDTTTTTTGKETTTTTSGKETTTSTSSTTTTIPKTTTTKCFLNLGKIICL